MKRKRRSAEEKRQEWADAQAHAWDLFRPKVAAVKCVADAKAIFEHLPPETAPGRSFYSNFHWFIMNLSVPGGATAKENALYLDVVRAFAAAGEIKLETKQRVKTALEKALKNPSW